MSFRFIAGCLLLVLGSILLSSAPSSWWSLKAAGVTSIAVGIVNIFLTILGDFWGQTCAYHMWIRSFSDDATIRCRDKWFYQYGRYIAPWRVKDITPYVEREISLDERRPWCPREKVTVQDISMVVAWQLVFTLLHFTLSSN